MKIEELAERTAIDVRTKKESWLALCTTTEHTTDMRNMVQGFRGEETVVMIFPAKTDRDDTLTAARVAAVGFGCDTLSFTTESWHPNQHGDEDYTMYNPVTGQRSTIEQSRQDGGVWGPGTMQDAAENHDALAKGWLTEALMTMVVNRAGDLVSVMQDYKLTPRVSPLGILSYAIEWSEAKSMSTFQKGAELGGYVPQQLVEYMNTPTMQHDLAQEGLNGADFDLTPVQAQAHMDCAVVKYVLGAGFFEGAVILASNDPERTKVIDTSLGSAGEHL